MRGHPPDPRRCRKSREWVGAQYSTRPASGRFRRGYAVLVGRNRDITCETEFTPCRNWTTSATPACQRLQKVGIRPESMARRAVVPMRTARCCSSLRANSDRCPPTGADLPSGSRPAKLPPVRSLLRSPWRHSSRDRSLDAERSYLWTASDRPAERLYA